MAQSDIDLASFDMKMSSFDNDGSRVWRKIGEPVLVKQGR
jgi:hypothetical protein